ncbi:MAG: membrane-bound lytic murein transglycosylase MltF [Deltaproteobacteria bacterium]|nr:membrane-bound lytic murein transglycosylase MltF [Deltaproteobacteria bacterium]
MKGKQWRNLFLILVFLGLPIFASCGRGKALDRIEKSGEITVLTRNNAHCYYIYRDKPTGFEYDLARAFSEYLGVKLKVVTPTWEGLIDALNSEKGDFIAASMTITESRKKLIDFSDEYLSIQQNSIQQKVILHANDYQIQRIEDLQGKTIHVRLGTSYEERLRQLKYEGMHINIKLHEDTPTEELIRMVAEKEIEITVADSNIAALAALNRRYYPDVKIAFAIEKPQALGWGVKKRERALLKKINKFLQKIKENGTLRKLYETHYAYVEIFDYADLKRYHRRIKTRLPKYEKIIRQAALKYGFDWRLIAAVIYQESHFDPGARSFTGVKGIMQLTRETAKEMGIKDRSDPEQSIMGGVKYIDRLYKGWSDANDPDRLLITIASYNVGRGHILDAREIALEKGLDPNSWSDLKEILPLLRYAKYYKKSRYGYCRGTEPVNYVKRILTYYDILKREAIT